MQADLDQIDFLRHIHKLDVEDARHVPADLFFDRRHFEYVSLWRRLGSFA